jgi:hypothetical protein
MPVARNVRCNPSDMLTRGLSVLGILLLAGVAQASTIPLSGGGFGWVSIDPFVPNGNGTPYFDHDSWDGNPPGGIWPVLNNTVGISDSRLEFWGTSGGGADPGILFDLATGQESATFVLKFEFAGNAAVNEFGWFAAGSPSVLTPIFGGPATAGASSSVLLPSGPYGFYLKNTANGQVFLSLSGSSPTDLGLQHFSVFRDTASPDIFWIGVEDLPLEWSDQDFNDLVLTARAVGNTSDPSNPAAVTPEPGTVVLLASGAAALGLRLRRRRRSP